MAIEEGTVVFCEFGEVPRVVRSRLVVGTVDPGTFNYIVLTPDYDMHDDILDASNTDFSAFHMPGPNNGFPPGIPPAAIYSFAPMAAVDYARYMMHAAGEPFVRSRQPAHPTWNPSLALEMLFQ